MVAARDVLPRPGAGVRVPAPSYGLLKIDAGAFGVSGVRYGHDLFEICSGAPGEDRAVTAATTSRLVRGLGHRFDVFRRCLVVRVVQANRRQLAALQLKFAGQACVVPGWREANYRLSAGTCPGVPRLDCAAMTAPHANAKLHTIGLSSYASARLSDGRPAEGATSKSFSGSYPGRTRYPLITGYEQCSKILPPLHHNGPSLRAVKGPRGPSSGVVLRRLTIRDALV
jgi:hypothetical protein